MRYTSYDACALMAHCVHAARKSDPYFVSAAVRTDSTGDNCKCYVIVRTKYSPRLCRELSKSAEADETLPVLLKFESCQEPVKT